MHGFEASNTVCASDTNCVSTSGKGVFDLEAFKSKLCLNIDCPKPEFGNSNDGNTT